MPALIQAECHNRLLYLMKPEDFASIADDLEWLALPKGTVLAAPGREVEHVYFPSTGIASISAISPEGHKVEAGLFGCCGFGPVAPLLGVEAGPTEIVVQVPGEGHRIGCDVLIRAAARNPSLCRLLRRYIHVLTVQTAHTALSNTIHQIHERLARWILMVHDRSASDELWLTHDFIAVMLVVRRPSVTTSLHILEGSRFIRSERRLITVRDRPGLEEFARDAYGVPEAEYQRLIGPLR